MVKSLFSMFCFNCKTPNPKVDIKENGTMATVTQICSNCGPGSRVNAAVDPAIHFRKFCCWECDVMFCYSDVWCANKQGLFTVQASCLCSVTNRTYFIHQKELLIPSVMDKVKKIKNATWSGDGHFGSMGHSPMEQPAIHFRKVCCWECDVIFCLIDQSSQNSVNKENKRNQNSKNKEELFTVSLQ